MIHNINNENSKYIAANLINNGEIIVYPTDTLYGFGVDATNSKAIKKLNKLKKREQPYSIIVETITMLKKYADISFKIEQHLKKFLPGPYTFILKNKCNNNLSQYITLSLNTIGIRIPNHYFPVDIVGLAKTPIITTSVNIHDSKSMNDIRQINKEFKNINIFYDENVIKRSLGSTIIDFSTDNPRILRQGDGKYLS